MNHSNIRFQSAFRPAGQFRTGISLHGHTLHSKESLSFINHLAKKVAPIRVALARGEARYRAFNNSALDLTRAWWTPPFSAYDAWKLETRHIQDQFGLDALVSLSDHDNIDASATLQLREECRPVPVSVEWTVPVEGTFFHLGIHNIPADDARALMSDFAAYTDRSSKVDLRSLLEALAANPEVLIIFNHPNWDESGFGKEAHRAAAYQFATTYQPFIHAFELNGLRPWAENRSVFHLADHFGKPLISGGDRHGMEPNTLLNTSNAGTFAEFVEEIRGGFSDLLITNQYLEPLSLRILQNLEDILGEYDNHAFGWKRWNDRTFYLCDDGVTRPLSQVWKSEPLAVTLFTGGVNMLRHPHVKNMYRMAFAKREEVML